MIALVLVILALTGGGSAVMMSQSNSSIATSSFLIDHIVVIVMENKSLNSTHNCGGNCSYITQLANDYGLAGNYSGVAHKPAQLSYTDQWW